MSSYTHINNEVEAMQFTAETKSDIIKVLMEAVALGTIDKLTVKQDTILDLSMISYQNVNSSRRCVLTINDYLIRLNTGDYITMSEEEFKQKYVGA